MSNLKQVQIDLFNNWKGACSRLLNQAGIVQNNWEDFPVTDEDIQMFVASVASIGKEIASLREDILGAYQEFKHKREQDDRE